MKASQKLSDIQYNFDGHILSCSQCKNYRPMETKTLRELCLVGIDYFNKIQKMKNKSKSISNRRI